MKWLLIFETAILGLVMLAALPMWAMVPMLFGVTEHTSNTDARPIYILLILFPIVAIGSLFFAWQAEPGSLLRNIMMLLPIVHLMVLFIFRVKH